MFGTMVVQLPSDYEGGELLVRLRNKHVMYNFSGTEGSMGFHFAAFYADCEHELREVTSGYRLCLVYNLVYKGKGAQPVPADNRVHIKKAVACMREWDAHSSDSDAPEKVAFVLEHQYCSDSLSFNGLKNVDRARANVLLSAQRKVKFDLYLTTMTWNHIHGASYDSYYGPCSFEAEELIEEKIEASDWVCPDGEQESFGLLPFDKEEILPEDAVDDVEPDEEDFNETTGNEGATVERWYHKAALVVWPRPQRLNVLGLERMITCLKKAIDKSSANDDNMHLAEKLVMLSTHKNSHDVDEVAIRELLSCLKALSVPELAEKFLGTVSFRSNAFFNELLSLCNTLGWSKLMPGLKTMFMKSTSNVELCVDLLGKLVGIDSNEVLQPDRKSICKQLALIVGNLIQEESDVSVPSVPEWYRYSNRDSYGRTLSYLYQREVKSRSKEFVCNVLQIFYLCGESAEGVLAAIKEQPNRYPIDSVVVPVLEEVHNRSGSVSHAAALVTLLPYCITALEAATVQQVSNPSTWAMQYSGTCTCTDCKQLKKFVKSAEGVMRFTANKSRRYHIHQVIDSLSVGGDLDHITERVGDPQTLVITKTLNSVERKKKKYEENLATLEVLRHIRDTGEPLPKRLKA